MIDSARSPLPRRRSRGFTLSVELLLMTVVLGFGLLTAWTRLRDQSLSEIRDTVSAVDAYMQGSAPLWETGGTRWIKDNAVLAPDTGNVTEDWANNETFNTVALANNTYTSVAGRLVYTPAAKEK